MISQVNSAVVRNSYANATQESKDTNKTANVSAQGDTSKIEQIKEALDAGEYKVNIEALSEKIADELLG
jgi:anti-sigma28 factor (negative regulator of flagellin synthesis)